MDYALHNLSTRSFEHLVQALALQALGPGLSVFGDGPDGGREATYSGLSKYTTGAGEWDGYVVVQAKFRQRPMGASEDGDWLLKQLASELAEFTKPNSRRTKPEYYILATNVTLSAVQAKGYKDKVASLLASEDFGLKSFDVWDYDKLRAMLDAAPDLVRTYCAWISTGDVLHEAMSRLERATPDFDATLGRYLQSELLADQFANLEQAGYSADERVPMASVFVDLPVAATPRRARDEEPETELFVSQVLASAPDRLARSCTLGGDDSGRQHTKGVPGRWALIGGPGQGKTTLGQFVCQLFRSAILLTRPEHVLDPDAFAAAVQVRQWCETDGYELPAVRRFPVRVSLSEFAAALEEDEAVFSILTFLASRITAHTSQPVDMTILREWLATYPWLVVLDGLDEVPPSSNRDAVLRAVQEFNIEIAESDADALVVATTRPQGYSDDFSPRTYLHRYLVPLSSAQALGYGERLSTIRFGENLQRYERARVRLAAAVDNPTTARLMTSPLQVTIMTILVDKQGHPPQERWTLFSAYYSAIYSRELERDVPTSRVLRSQQTNVDAIHRRVGLLLQAESERAAGTDARMPTHRFRAVVRDRLEEEGYEGSQLDSLERQIVEAAANRLVFLVGLQEGQVGFEIRSLQEFMAAEGLMEGTDEQVRGRLRAIAVSPSWRNVFLFACGKCFSDRQHLRDSIHTIAAELNESGDRSVEYILAGSRLALDILDEGSVNQQPRFARLFGRLALRLVELPPEREHRRLADAYTSTLASNYESEAERRIGSGAFADRLGLWSFLLALAANDVNWACELTDRHWPADEGDALSLLALIRHDAVFGQRLTEIVSREILRQPVWSLARTPILIALGRNPHAPTWLRPFADLVHRMDDRRPAIYSKLGEETTIALDIRSLRPWLDGAFAPLSDAPEEAADWRTLRLLGEFSRDPTLERASAVLRDLADSAAHDLPSPLRSALHQTNSLLLASLAPWPIASLLFSASSLADAHERADGMKLGTYGTVDEWAAAEDQWRAEPGDFLARFDPDHPVWNAVPSPVPAAEWAQVGRVPTDDPARLVRAVEGLPPLSAALTASALLNSLTYTQAEIGSHQWRPSLDDWIALRRFAPETSDSTATVVMSLERISLPTAVEAVDVEALAAAFRPAFVSGYSQRRHQDVLLSAVTRAIANGATDIGIAKLLVAFNATEVASGSRLAESDLPQDREDRFALLLVKLATGSIDVVNSSGQLTEILNSHPYRFEVLRSAVLRSQADQQPQWENLLVRMIEHPASTRSLQRAATTELVTAVGRRLSVLAVPEQWRRRGLYLPEDDSAGGPG